MTNTVQDSKSSRPLYDAEKLWESAQLAHSKRQYSDAESLYKRAIAKLQEVLGDDANVSRAIDELGLLYMEMGKDAEAEQQFKASMEMAERKYYAGHTSVASPLEHMAELYVKQGKFAEAEPVATRALDVYDKTLSGEHRNTLKSLHRLAHIQMKLGKNPEAEKSLTKALKNVDTPLGPYQEFKYDLARLFEGLDKPAEAEKAYKEAIEGFEYRRTVPRLAECLESYAAFLTKQNRSDEAAKIKVKADVMSEIAKSWQSNHDIFPSTLLRA